MFDYKAYLILEHKCVYTFMYSVFLTNINIFVFCQIKTLSGRNIVHIPSILQNATHIFNKI